MAKREKLLKCRGYIGNEKDGYVPIESLTPEELEAWRQRVCERVGRVLSDYFSQHIDEYQKIGRPVE